MKVSCPSCHAELTLDLLLGHEAARHAVARLAMLSLPFGALALRYIALFKPEKRSLSIEKMVRLVEDLLPDIERRAITRKGRDWAAPIDAWRAGIELVLSKRDKGTLTLPLTSHGLLYEVMAGLADKHEAREEAEGEQDRRQRRTAGVQAGPRNLASVAQDLGATPGAPAVHQVAPAPAYTGPSRAALQIRAQIEATQRRRTAGPADEPAEAAAQPQQGSPT